ncbi:MAG: glycine--tRNA ligase [Planctomycetota bacterium]|jgi:glycyl-tRNA synthetase
MSVTDHRPADVMKKLVALCKRRGFVFQSSEIYGGLKSAYDYGPLGVELKRNVMNEWWTDMVHSRENVVGIDASIIMKPDVWRASGHAAGFADPLVDCHISKERFRADKAPRPEVGAELPIECADKGQAKVYQAAIAKRFGIELPRDGKTISGLYVKDATTVGAHADDSWSLAFRGYVSPLIGSPFLSEERQFNLMFRTALGAIDPMQDVSDVLARLTAAEDLVAAVRAEFGDIADDSALGKALAGGERARIVRAVIEQISGPSMAYLRPETAQAMFVQFKNVMDSTGSKPPFGIAQMGKSFRNEVTVEHFIFRSCEFEQMEMEFFCEPGTQSEWMSFWKDARMAWWQRYANYPEHFIYRQHEADELAHYADDCYDVEYFYPWGWDELEGIASRTDHDLHEHEIHSGQKLRFTDPSKEDPATGKAPWSYRPFVIEPAAGATRAVLAYLLDAYHEEQRTDAKGKTVTRTVLKLHPRLSPIKCAVLPLVSNKDEFVAKARAVIDAFLAAGIPAKLDSKGSVGKRYAKHDEVGTPYCITIDGDTFEDGTVTIRDRDTTEQVRIAVADAVEQVRARLNG